jgi:hypothetical protein
MPHVEIEEFNGGWRWLLMEGTVRLFEGGQAYTDPLTGLADVCQRDAMAAPGGSGSQS